MTNHAAQDDNFMLALRNKGFDNITTNSTSATSNSNDYHVDECISSRSRSLGFCKEDVKTVETADKTAYYLGLDVFIYV